MVQDKNDKMNRRGFLRAVGAAGFGSVLAAGSAGAGPNEPNTADPNAGKEAEQAKLPEMPKRKLGKTGVEVPALSLGAMFNVLDNQLVLRKALDWGVDYWDCAYGYSGGNSELGIGKFISRDTEVRKKLFLTSKASGAKTIEETDDRLQTSLKRMQTDYIDIYYGVHMLSDPAPLTDELKSWAAEAKKKKQIRFFGFSTHSNMAKCMMAASKLDWIDVIMTSYNFRLMQDSELNEAIQACCDAGIALIAMKTQARGQSIETDQDKKLAGHFLQRGFTEGQAKIKAVLEDKRFSSACVGMTSVAFLSSGVGAVLDRTELSKADMAVFDQYARQSCDGYCAGCADICGAAVPEVACVADVMRYLMYYNSYGERKMAKALFAEIPGQIRDKLLKVDYSLAEQRCPQRIPIGRLMAEAVGLLA